MPSKPRTIGAPASRRGERDAARGSFRQRGYHSGWDRLRPVYLRSHPLCVPCLEGGRTTAASEIHHIVPLRQGGELLDPDNLLAVCHPCHMAIEAKARRAKR